MPARAGSRSAHDPHPLRKSRAGSVKQHAGSRPRRRPEPNFHFGADRAGEVMVHMKGTGEDPQLGFPYIMSDRLKEAADAQVFYCVWFHLNHHTHANQWPDIAFSVS